MNDATGPTDPADRADHRADGTAAVGGDEAYGIVEADRVPSPAEAEQDAAVRRALADLPALTMPTDIRTRLAEMIAGESAARASGVLEAAEAPSVGGAGAAAKDSHRAAVPADVAASAAPAAPASAVIDLDAKRRFRWRTAVPAMAGAAAALVVGGVVVTQTVGSGSPDVVAGPNPTASGSLAASPDVSGGTSTQAGAAGWHAAEPALMATETDYRSTTMADQVRAQLRVADAAASGLAAAAPSALPTADAQDQRGSFVVSQEALRACMAWIERGDAKVLMVDLARFEGAPAAVVAVDPDAPSAPNVDEAEVWVLQRECNSETPQESSPPAASDPSASPGSASEGPTAGAAAATVPLRPTAPVVTVTLRTANN